MTTLTLRIENHATLDNGGPVALTLTGKGAQIGRKAGNDWVLPDASRHISGHHFDITFEGGNFFLTDVSSNGTFLHGERYRIDGTHQIADGDRFTVGHYILCAQITADAAPAVTDPPAAPAPTPAPAPVPPAFAQTPEPAAPPPVAPPPVAPPSPADEFDDVWGDLGGGSGGSGLQAPPAGQTLAPSPTTGVQAPTPYAQDGGGTATQQPDFNRVTAAPGLAPTTPPQFGIPGAGAISTPPAFGGGAPEPQAAPPQPAPAAPAPPPVAPPPEPIGSEGFGIGQHVAPAAQPAYPQAMAPQPGGGGGDAFLRAFMEGAGITDTSQLQMPPEMLGRILGQVARTGTNELMRMLQDRAAVKLFVSNEDRTMRVATGNNPMKFMIDTDQAFEALFLKPRDGYLTGADGFENALSDIRRHQAAVIAALQPALAEMLGGLSPDDIEGDIGGGIMGGGARKAWDEFTKRWEARAAQGENGMLDAFIKAFSRHYADALRKM
ncbi:type VI secretion system-associated FHA domain protein TagH [uncultured Tateyamaria sp.]|uniref:type VI secretion system-associated FHA domain protein TagH n=1 Tax=Tateyamaria sp. 1078 TaxID=3417464 RepID=UPI002610E598|nr:type VI secretion system-associated FHA domain protein TagH [uncultured Tateyamaria sp.]